MDVDVWVIVALAAIGAGMSLATAVVLKWAAFARTGVRAAVVLFFLLMMTGMFAGAAIYFVAPSVNNFVLGLWAAAGLMSAAVILVFAQVVRDARAAPPGSEVQAASPLLHPWIFQGVVVATVIGNELLMGWTFQRAAGGPVWLGDGGVGALVSNLLVSPWFVLPMAFEMACTLAWLRSEFPRPMLGLLAFQPILMFASPPSGGTDAWQVSTAIIASAAMAGAVGYLLWLIFRGTAVSRPILRYATALYAVLGLMAVGLAAWVLTGEVALYSVAVVAQMLVFLAAVLAPSRFESPSEDRPENADRSTSGAAARTRESAPLVPGDRPQLRSE